MILGGICLDGYDTIPEPYNKYLHIGKNVMVKTGTILCGEGFHFKKIKGKQTFTPHNFGVEIQDDVWIGSNCTVDRGRIRDTVISNGTKIDNGVHISHNCIIGSDCIIATGSILLGSCEVGNGTEIWSNAIIHQGVKIGNNCAVGANTYLRHDLKDNMVAYMTSNGMVIKPITDAKKYGGIISKKCLNGKCSADSGW
jgi:UDP-3-O-[3-hydroxymyristoyl] glucosamine N-acyltransferase